MKEWIPFGVVLQLRKQIVLNSLFVSDYRNDLGIDPNEACNFFDGYVEFLVDEMLEDHPNGVPDHEYFSTLFTYDTNENLYRWWNCFDECPLTIRKEEEE